MVRRLLLNDLRKCDLLADWRKVAQKRAAWKGIMKTMSGKLKNQLEAAENKKKDGWKMKKGKGTQPAPFEV